MWQFNFNLRSSLFVFPFLPWLVPLSMKFCKVSSFSLSYLVYNQIWSNFHVDDHHFDYIKKCWHQLKPNWRIYDYGMDEKFNVENYFFTILLMTMIMNVLTSYSINMTCVVGSSANSFPNQNFLAKLGFYNSIEFPMSLPHLRSKNYKITSKHAIH